MAPRILVVDDEESIRFTFSIFLTEEGFDVTTAENFNQAMALLTSQKFDLIFLDIIMEGKTGIDLLQEIGNMGMNVPVIIITGAPSIETAAEALRMGAFDYIIKPIRQEVLLRSVSIGLKHRSLIEEKERCRHNYESIFRSVKEGIITFDRDMTLTDINDAALNLCRLARGAVLGRSLEQLPLACRGGCLAALQESQTTRESVQKKYIECHAESARNQVVSVTTTPLQGADKDFTGTVMVIHDETQVVELKRHLQAQQTESHLLGNTETIRNIRAMINNLADVHTTVLVTGESGTGKEIVVDELHNASDRRSFPLVKVNCAALSEELLESELFGHVKGAFTGAIKDKVGRFQRADGGTLFLDEIGDISLRMQARLLRVIETMEFERVGDSTPLKVDVRVVAATNKNLPDLVGQGRFREDLYYRLKVVEIELPSLRERRDDIPLLTHHFINKYNRRFNRSIREVSSETMAIFQQHGWPGNIRQLENTMEHAFICCPDEVVTTEHLPEGFNPAAEETKDKVVRGEQGEAEVIRQALEKARWNKSKAAEMLGISRRTMYRKLDKYGAALDA